MTSGVALIIASVLFGVNHVAYCRLFNTVEMFGQLALVSEENYCSTTLDGVKSLGCI